MKSSAATLPLGSSPSRPARPRLDGVLGGGVVRASEFRYGYGYRNYLYRYRPYYYGSYAYSYGPRWKHRLPLLRLGKKGLAPRANLAGVERSGRKARTIHYLVSGSLQQTIGVGLAPALLVLLPFVYGTPAGIGRVSECGFF